MCIQKQGFVMVHAFVLNAAASRGSIALAAAMASLSWPNRVLIHQKCALCFMVLSLFSQLMFVLVSYNAGLALGETVRNNPLHTLQHSGIGYIVLVPGN
jgi:hypothetical protein